MLTKSLVSIYAFDPKSIFTKPVLLESVPLVKAVKYLHVLREGVFSLCYEDSI